MGMMAGSHEMIDILYPHIKRPLGTSPGIVKIIIFILNSGGDHKVSKDNKYVKLHFVRRKRQLQRKRERWNKLSDKGFQGEKLLSMFLLDIYNA